MDKQVEAILSLMSNKLSNEQLRTLHSVLISVLINPTDGAPAQSNEQMLEAFLAAKNIEGCSKKTIEYYKLTITKALLAIDKPVLGITTEELRTYLGDYQTIRNSSPVTINNMRRVLSSFFSWLEDEGVLLKSPMRRIKAIKTPIKVKAAFTSEQVEQIRESVGCVRDLAIVDLLASTGMRVSELISLDRDDFNFDRCECIVVGKGNKERTVYFDDRAKLHLKHYFSLRSDSHPAAFIRRNNHSKRLGTNGVQKMVRRAGNRAGIDSAHPHKFRRTLATKAIGKGMPIEQVQHLLGHTRIDTTLHYAMVDEANVKISHRRFIC